MKIEITAKPVFWLYMSLEQVKLISECASVHYDSACRASAKVGGFVYGWMNSKSANPDMPLQAAFRDVDTALKCLEIGYHFDEHAGPSKQLSMELRRAMFKANQEISKIRIEMEV